MPQRLERAAEHVGRVPVPDNPVLSEEVDGEGGERVDPFAGPVGDGMPLAEEIRAMEAVGRNRVGGGEPPVREDGLHDLEAVRNPVDAVDEFPVIHVRPRGRRHMEDDFWLDERLRQARQIEAPADRLEIVDGAVEHVVPDRPVDPVGDLDRPVGEADLTADRGLAAGGAHVADPRSDRIGLAQSKPWIARGERRDLPTCAEKGERLPGDGLNSPFPLRRIHEHRAPRSIATPGPPRPSWPADRSA